MNVFITTPTRLLFNSTDANYIFKKFINLSKYYDINFILNKNILSSLHINTTFIISLLSHKITYNAGFFSFDKLFCKPPINTDIIFSYGTFPETKLNKPIICEQSYAPANKFYDKKEWFNHLRKTRSKMIEFSKALITPSPESF